MSHFLLFNNLVIRLITNWIPILFQKVLAHKNWYLSESCKIEIVTRDKLHKGGGDTSTSFSCKFIMGAQLQTRSCNYTIAFAHVHTQLELLYKLNRAIFIAGCNCHSHMAQLAQTLFLKGTLWPTPGQNLIKYGEFIEYL